MSHGIGVVKHYRSDHSCDIKSIAVNLISHSTSENDGDL